LKNSGVAEKFNRKISSFAKTILFGSKLSLNLLDFTFKQAAYIYNFVSHKSINNKIPDEIYYGKDVKFDQIKTFRYIL